MTATKPSKQNEFKSGNWDEFYAELQNESHRGGVLVGAAFLDEHLHQLLLAFLADDKVSVDLLKSGGLSNFSNRIDLAYALGLISRDLRNDLHVVRSIRNEFAHSLQGLTLRNEWVISQIDTLAPTFIRSKRD